MQAPQINSIDLVEADEALVGPDQPVRQLRLALAMRGGVSLAVWIGGAVAEIDRLRTKQSLYAALLEANGFNDVIVDVISGASAGGLNGAVYTAAQLRHFEVARTQELWVQVGDIERLARATTPGQRAKAAAKDKRVERLCRTDALRPPSILRGDEYFYPTLLDAMEELSSEALKGDRSNPPTDYDQGTAPSNCERDDESEVAQPEIDLLLSATLFNPEIARVTIDDTVIERPAANALFRFTSRNGTSIPINQLAMAARATSSFPFAFETARIAVCSDSAAQAIDRIDFNGVFELPPGARRNRIHRVMDGGVLDNIPVAAAIDAVVAAPAQQRTERWICYLHPSPTELKETDLSAAGPRGLQILMRTARARFNQESLLDDIEVLKQVGEKAKQRTQLRDALFAAVSHPMELSQLVDDSRDRLADLSDLLDATRITQHLHGASGDGNESGFVQWEPEQQQQFNQALRTRLAEHRGGLASTPTISTVDSAIELLIAFARSIEDRLDGTLRDERRGTEARTVSDIKGDLYNQRSQLAAVIAVERASWAAAIAGVSATTDPSSYITGALLDHRFATDDVWRHVVELGRTLLTPASTSRILDAKRFDKPFSLLVMDPHLETTLLNVVLMSQPVQLLGPGPWSAPKFVYVNGAAECLLETGLENDSGSGLGLDARDKLCGNELGNFASFLSARWRANDWLWGRLDTASTLVDQLVSDELLTSPEARKTITDALKVAPDIDDLRGEVKRVFRRRFSSPQSRKSQRPATALLRPANGQRTLPGTQIWKQRATRSATRRFPRSGSGDEFALACVSPICQLPPCAQTAAPFAHAPFEPGRALPSRSCSPLRFSFLLRCEQRAHLLLAPPRSR